MSRTFVDLSIYFENEVLSDPPPLAPKIQYQRHKETVKEFMQLVPGVNPEDFPDGEVAAAEWVSLSTHNGTHLGAPFSYTSQKVKATGNKALIWEGHCLPHKIRGASAGWARAVAIFDEALSRTTREVGAASN